MTELERFCDGIYIGESDNHKKTIDSLRDLPCSPLYRQFFLKEDYDKLYYAQNYEELKSSNRQLLNL